MVKNYQTLLLIIQLLTLIFKLQNYENSLSTLFYSY